MKPVGSRTQKWVRLTTLALVLFAAITVFVLPWFIPPGSRDVVSDSQSIGFSNRIAMIGMALSAAGLALVGMVARSSRATDGTKPLFSVELPPAGEQIRPWLVAAASLISGAAVVLLGLFYRKFVPVGDGSYFVNAILLLTGNHASFSSVFSYGPLLLYPPLLAGRLAGMDGVGLIYMYYAWAAVCFAISPVLYAYVLNRLSLSSRVRRWVFVLLSLHGLSIAWYLGASTTAIRCVLPYALLLWGLSGVFQERSLLHSYGFVSAAALVGYSVSPEMGIALVLAFSCALAMQWMNNRSRQTALVLGAFVATMMVGLFLLKAASSGTTLGDFAGGAFYLPVIPSLFTIAFTIAVLSLGFGIGSQCPASDGKVWALHLGWFVLAIVYLAPALGRADWGHILGNGMGMLLGSMAVANRRWKRPAMYSLAVLGVFLIAHFTTYTMEFPTMYAKAFQRGVWSGSVNKRVAVALAPVSGQTAESAAQIWTAIRDSATSRHRETARLAKMKRLAFFDPYATDVVLYLIQHGDLASGYLDPGQALSVAYYDHALSSLEHADSIAIPKSLYDHYMELIRPTGLDSVGHDGHVYLRRPTVVPRALSLALFGMPIDLHGRNADFSAEASFARILRSDWKIAYQGTDYVALVRQNNGASK